MNCLMTWLLLLVFSLALWMLIAYGVWRVMAG